MMEDWMKWLSYNFQWTRKEDLGWFKQKRCNLRAQTFFFGGERQSKWILGKYTIHLLSTLKSFFKEKLDHIEFEFDENGHFKNMGAWRRTRERYLQLMIGSDYLEPCVYNHKVPKVVNFKFSFPADELTAYGAFDFFIGKGLSCGQGRFGRYDDPPEPHNLNNPRYKAWADEMNTIWKKMDTDEYRYDQVFPVADTKNPPLVSFNPGEIPFFSGQHVDRKEAHGRFITSALFDDSEPEQKLCGIFHCHNPLLPCAVSIEEWFIGDIAGLPYESGQGGVEWNLTPMDMFTLVMMVFTPLFFCVQCCCFCQICAGELRGGIIDEQAILEQRVMQEHKRRKNRSRSPQRRRRSPRRRARD